MTPAPHATGVPTRPRILVVDADPALFGLFEAWLGAEAELVAGTRHTTPPADVDLVVVDVPFARQAAAEGLRDLATRHAGAPLLALSPTLFAGVASEGAVARRLGVAAVLPTPVARESFVAAVRRLLGRAA